MTASEVFMRRQRVTSCARCTNNDRALGRPVRKSVVAELSACWYFNAFSTDSATFEATASKIRKWSGVNASCAEWYIASTPTTPFNPCSGTTSADNMRRGLGIGDIAFFHLRIAIDDGLAILRHPTAQTFPYTNFQGRENPKVFSAHQFRQEPSIAVHENRDRIVRNQLAQPHRQHRKGFAQAQRISQILAQIEHSLRLLPRRCDRGKEVVLILRTVPWTIFQIRPRAQDHARLADFSRTRSAQNRPADLAPYVPDPHGGEPAPPLPWDRTMCRRVLSRFAIARSSGIAGRYCRSDARASRQSTTVRIRAPIGISSPASPAGYPDPSQRS